MQVRPSSLFFLIGWVEGILKANRGWMVVSLEGANMPFADGSAQFLMSPINPVPRRAMATRNYGEVVRDGKTYTMVGASSYHPGGVNVAMLDVPRPARTHVMTRTNPGIRPMIAALALVGAGAADAPAAGFPWKTFAARPDDWYRGDEAARLAENVLSHQSERGDWPKNFDTSAVPYRGDRSQLRGTFDNGATVGEMRFLARTFVATGRARYRGAFLKALDHVLAAQYPGGGWPQSDPPGTGYARYITFNDNTAVNLLELARDVARSDGFRFVDQRRREAAAQAFARGIDCILRCQVRVDGRLTAWCAQHDPTTLEPRGARTYELPSLSGGESAGLLLLLMSLEDPGPDVVRAVRAGARWYEDSKIEGIRQVVVDGDKKVVPDPSASPLWARFYEIGTNRPFFCGRDGVKKKALAEIEAERRNGYAWYGDWGRRVLERYARWEKSRSKDESGRRKA